jgi:hypothetical protein
MTDIRYLEKFLNNIREKIERNVLEDMDDFQADFEDIIVDQFADSRIYTKQIQQIITDLEEGLVLKIIDTKENLDDPDLISENIDRIYDLMTMIRKEIDELLNSLNKEFEAEEYSDQAEAEDVLNALKDVRKYFNTVFEEFEDAYYNDELTLDM